jgi:hypothetical protein
MEIPSNMPREFARMDGETAVQHYNRLNAINAWLYSYLRGVKAEASLEANMAETKRRAIRDEQKRLAKEQERATKVLDRETITAEDIKPFRDADFAPGQDNDPGDEAK